MNRNLLIGGGVAMTAVAALHHFGTGGDLTGAAWPTWASGIVGVAAALFGWFSDKPNGGGDMQKLLQELMADGKLDAADLAKLVSSLGGKFDITKLLDLLKIGGKTIPTEDDIVKFQRIIQEILQLKALRDMFTAKGMPSAINFTVTWADGVTYTVNLDTLPKPKPPVV